MAENKAKVNINRNKGPIIAGASIICALIAAAVLFFVFEDILFFNVAQSRALERDFTAACEWCELSDTEDARVLGDYSSLRADINENYPKLVSDFDIEKIRDWLDEAEKISEQAEECKRLDASVGKKLEVLTQKLSLIVQALDEYEALKPEITELAGLFKEYGYLYTKDANGKNIVFTVRAELEKLDRWELLNNNLLNYLVSYEETQNVYLINFFNREAMGEIEYLRNAFVTSGFGPDEPVCLQGDDVRVYRSVQHSGGEKMTLLDTEKYTNYMYEELCGEFAEILGEFYEY